MTACFCDCIGLIIYMYIQETFLSYTAGQTPVIFSAISFKNQEQTKFHCDQ